MTNITWALLLKPFIALVFLGLIVLPLVMLAKRYLPEGKLKEFLFKERMPHWKDKGPYG